MGNTFTLKLRKFVATLSLTTLLASMLVVPQASGANLDEAPSWARNAVEELADLSQSSLRLNDATDKCEFSKMLTVAFGLEEETLDPFTFTDVPEWAKGYVGAMVNNEIAKGDSATKFGCGAPMSRAVQVKMIVNALGLEEGTLDSKYDSEFAGVEWAKGAFAAALTEGIVKGDDSTGALRPAANANRAESFVLAYRAMGGDESEGEEGEENAPGGDLSVSLSSETPKTSNIPKDASSVAFATFDFEAEDGDVNLSTLKVTRYGLGDEEDFDNVWLADENGVRVTSSRSLTRDDNVELTFPGGYTVEDGETVALTVMAELQNATAGTQHVFGIASEEDVNASGADVSGSFPLKGNELEVSDFTVGTLGFSANGSGKTVEVGDVDVELGQFKIVDESDANNTDVTVKSVTLEINGTTDNENVANLVLTQAGTVVSEKAVVEGDFAAFVFKDGGYEFDDGDSRVFQIRGDVIGGSDGETLIFSLDKGSDITGEVPGLGAYTPRVVGDDTPTSSDSTASNVNLNTYSINGGDLAVAKDPSSRTNQTVAADTDDFDFLTLRLTAAQAMEISNIGFSFNANDAGTAYGGAAAALAGVNASLDDFRVYLHTAEETWEEGELVASEADATVGTTASHAAVSFDDDWEVEKGVFMLTFVADVLSAATTADEYSVAFDGGSEITAEYVSNGDTVSTSDITGGSTTGAEFTVGASSLDVTRVDDNANNDALIAGAQDFLVMEVVFDNNDVEDATVTELTFGQTGTIVDTSVISNCFLKDDADKVISDEEDYSDPSSTTTNDATLTFALNSDQEFMVKQNKQFKARLYCDVSTGADASKTLTVELDDVDAEDEDGDSVSVTEGGSTLSTSNPLASANFDIQAGGTLTLSVDPNTPDQDLLVASGSTTEVEIARFRLSATDDDIDLKDLTVRFADDDLSARVYQLYLYTEGGTTALDSASVVDEGTYAAADFSLSPRLTVPADSTKRVIVKARFNNISEVAQTGYTLQAYVSDMLMSGSENDIEAVSKSTGVELSSSNITVSGNGVVDVTTAYAPSAASQTNADALPVFYTFTGTFDPAIGDSVIVATDTTFDVKDPAATVTGVASGSGFSVAKSQTYTAANNDDVYVGSVSTAVDLDADDDTTNAANGNAEPVVLTVPAGHGFEAGDVLDENAYFFAGNSATEANTVTVTSVTSTTLYLTPGGTWDVTPSSDDFVLRKLDVATVTTEESRALADAHVLYNSIPALASANLVDTTLGLTTEEIYRFTVSANNGGDVSFSRVTFEVSQTDTEVYDFELRKVDTGGSVVETPVLGATTTSIELNTNTTNIGGNSNAYVWDVTTAADADKFVVGQTVRVTDGTATVGNQIATVTAVDITNGEVTLDPVGSWTAETDDDETVTVETHVGSDADAVGTEVTSGLVVVDLGTEEEVAAGQSKTYELRATTSDQAQQDFNSISTRILTDTARPTDNTAQGFTLSRTEDDMQDALSRFIWSDQPNSAEHVQSTSADYHNGYLLDGAPTASRSVSN